ncbi:hypothetical protein JKP88DRAFT_77658 [Tribonema minus]|uniref:Pentacotripeptide-repeat region of PRORP domain-containing protein n=1 Tax=Tribonema minus TaxID=303371 RepID=A0A835YSQ8_9STRA|nr:hypothetical protein JKP88DRAFT_77658 [Tribonema minus]
MLAGTGRRFLRAATRSSPCYASTVPAVAPAAVHGSQWRATRCLATKKPEGFRLARTPQAAAAVKDVRRLAKAGNFAAMLQRVHSAAAAPRATTNELGDLYAVAATQLARAARSEDALALLETAKERGAARPALYAAAVSAANKAGHAERALTLFQELRAAGLEAPTPTLCVAAEAAARAAEWSACAELLREMRNERGLGEAGGAYDNALQACADGGPKEHVYEFLDDLIIKSKREAGARVGKRPERSGGGAE